MSNYLSIATVTAALGRVAGEALERVPNPSGVPHVRFGAPLADPQHIGCTIFLYRVAPDPSRRNDDLPTRDDVGAYVQRPRLMLNAEYLFTFRGEENTLEAQRFLGAVATAFHAQPFLPAETIRRTVAGTAYLRGADFDLQTKIRLIPTTLDYHLMAQLWSTFPQVQYGVSLVYTATCIPVEADVLPRVLQPVQQVDTQVSMQ